MTNMENMNKTTTNSQKNKSNSFFSKLWHFIKNEKHEVNEVNEIDKIQTLLEHSYRDLERLEDIKKNILSNIKMLEQQKNLMTNE